MGAGNSKPSPGPSQYVFEATGARTSFSGDLVGSLESSHDSDSTRHANLEHKIQSRVTAELERLASEESSKLQSLVESFTNDSEKEESSKSSSDDADSSADDSPSLMDRLKDAAGSKQRQAALSNSSVSKEIAELKKKLEGRKRLEKPNAEVEKAKDELVTCLRTNDRRPLDCWKEKEAFQAAVGRLERSFVQRTVR